MFTRPLTHTPPAVITQAVIALAGDVEPGAVRAMVDKYWGGWKRGSYQPEIPPEPPQA